MRRCRSENRDCVFASIGQFRAVWQIACSRCDEAAGRGYRKRIVLAGRHLAWLAVRRGLMGAALGFFLRLRFCLRFRFCLQLVPRAEEQPQGLKPAFLKALAARIYPYPDHHALARVNWFFLLDTARARARKDRRRCDGPSFCHWVFRHWVFAHQLGDHLFGDHLFGGHLSGGHGVEEHCAVRVLSCREFQI